MTIKVVSSEKRFSGRALGVRVDRIRLEDGRETSLEIVDHPDSVVMVPVDADGGIWFVRQYRHAAGREILELPAGTLNPGEAPEACAGRELREEIGLHAERLTRIGGFFLAPGYATEFMHAYLAEGLLPDRIPGDEDEALFPEKHPRDDVRRMLGSGGFEDAKTIAALSLAFQKKNP
ncbi:MAG: NUDIX hydrolase [Anaerolineales bacterium]|nr:NUDIX hydrolase [Anaerolineales bacterium]